MKKFGKFINKGEEYLITDINTPRPQMNYTWNEKFLTAVNHFGGGSGAYGGRTASYIDPSGKGRCSLIREGNRYFYIQEENNMWNPGWYPVKTPLDHYQCIHGLGYSIIEGQLNGLLAKLKVFVPSEEPAEIWTITLKNKTDRKKEFSVYFVCDFLLEGYSRYSDYNSYVYSEFIKEHNLLMCYNNACERPHEWYHGFVASDREVNEFESSKKVFLGNYGGFESPQGIKCGELGNGLAVCEPMVGVLKHTFVLQPWEETEYHTILGAADDKETAIKLSQLIFTKGAIHREFKKLCENKEKLTRR